MRRFVALSVVAISIACSNDSTGPLQYETIAGIYTGALTGGSGVTALQAQFTATLTQTEVGTLGGTYRIAGTLGSGLGATPIEGVGKLAGTMAAGRNPSINVIITSNLCPNVREAFSGAYDSANRKVTMSGTVDIFNQFCQVTIAYPTTIVLSR